MISFWTSFSTFELSSLFSLNPFTTLKIKSPTSLNSSSPKPLVVHAGVPNLIPEVIIGLSVSKGIPFLLHVILALPKDACASFPVTPNDLKSISIK